MKRVWLASMLVAALSWTAGIGRAADEKPPKDSPKSTDPSTTPSTTPSATPSTAPKTAESPDSGKVKSKGRLPPYYGKLVDKDQKEKIYEIDSSFDPKIKDLKKQLEALTAQRDEQVKAVLTPEQQSKLADMIAEAKAKRRQKRVHAVDTKSAPSPKPADSSTAKASDQPAATTPAPVAKTDPSVAPPNK